MIPAGDRRDVGTGIALAIPSGYAGFVQPRSGLAFKHGIMVVNSPGLIDAGYRGEVRVSLYNSGREPFTVAVGERIAQLVVQKVEEPEFLATDELPDTSRGEGGFGSSEVRVSLYNSGREPFTVAVGERIAQFVVQKVEEPEFLAVDHLPDTTRGQGGFGSSGL